MERIFEEDRLIQLAESHIAYEKKALNLLKSNFIKQYLILWFNVILKIKQVNVWYAYPIGIFLFLIYPIIFPFIYRVIINGVKDDLKMVHEIAINGFRDKIDMGYFNLNTFQGVLLISGKKQ